MNLFKNVHESWIPLLHSLAYQKTLLKFLESLGEISFQPKVSEIFRVFEMPVENIKVVILGKEPYPIPGMSNGLAYGVTNGQKIPEISNTIRKEVVKTVVWSVGQTAELATLEKWENQGVFLLNTSLTVETGNAGSHTEHWRSFTEAIVSFISKSQPCIWLLWGINSASYKGRIQNGFSLRGYNKKNIEEIPMDPKLNYISEGFHPVATKIESRETFSENGFYYTNSILYKMNKEQINW
jgi:uracil-DNA glycosylase